MSALAGKMPLLLPRVAGIAGGVLTAILVLLAMHAHLHDDLMQQPAHDTITVRRAPPPPPPPPLVEQAETTSSASPAVAQPRWQADLPQLPDLPSPRLASQAGSPGAMAGWQPSSPEIPQAPAPQGYDQGAVLLTGPEVLRRFYPRAARQRRQEGVSRVRLQINREGRVTQVEVLSSQPRGVFDQAARSAAQQLRYQPAMRQGAAVETVVEEEMQWRLE